MKFYDTQGAPNPRRVRIYLAEKGLENEVEIEMVSIMKGEHKEPAYRKISPLSQVPALVFDDGTSITESVAICKYFETLHPTPSLFGVEAKQVALIEMWQRRFELMLFSGIAMHFRHTHPAMAALEKQNKEWGLLNKERVLKLMKFFNLALEGKKFIAGDYSFADITGIVCLDFATQTRISVPDEFTNLVGYHKRLSGRDSAKAGV